MPISGFGPKPLSDLFKYFKMLKRDFLQMGREDPFPFTELAYSSDQYLLQIPLSYDRFGDNSKIESMKGFFFDFL